MIAPSRRALVVGAISLLVVLALGALGWFWYNAEQGRAASAYAEALFRAGRHDEAVARQREAAKLRPRDREIVGQLAAFERAAQPGGGGGGK